MEKLRDEILQAQAQRGELLKWKLFLVAGFGGAALGLGGERMPASDLRYLLFLVPLLCNYADVLCRHLNLRILVIARFLRGADHNGFRVYEQLVEKARAMDGSVDAFCMEDWAIEYSTRILSVLVGVYGAFAADRRLFTLLLAAAFCGLALSLWQRHEYKKRARKIGQIT